MSDPQPRKVVPTGEQVNIRGVIFDMQQLEPMSDSPPPPTRTAPSHPSVSHTSEDQPSEKAAGKQREKMGPPSKLKVPSIRTIVESSEDLLSEKAIGEQSEESGLALGDSDKDKQSDKTKQKDERDTLPSSRKQEYQQGGSPKSKRRGRKVLSVMSVIGEEVAGSESDDKGMQAGGLA